jgi:uncharacterized membrane protein YdbT with pleckstrin-like domain
MSYLEGLLAEGEQVRLLAHRHVLFLLLRTILFFLAALALWVLAVVVLTQLETAAEWISLGLVLLSLVPLAIGVYRLLVWRTEQYAVTNYRIVQVEGIFSKRTFDSALEQVNDVEMTQSLLGRLFDYGNIDIITGSEIGVNHLTGIANPFEFKRALLATRMELSGFANARRPVTAVGQDPVRLLAALTELRDSGMMTPEEYEERKAQLLQRR